VRRGLFWIIVIAITIGSFIQQVFCANGKRQAIEFQEQKNSKHRAQNHPIPIGLSNSN
jgi:hypothetical protein